MKKSDRNSTFGAPKPLPGQAGYKETAIDVLQKDTKEMEHRLRMLQERMQKQQMDSVSAKGASSSSWKSARAEKGTIRSYAKDIQDKHRKKTQAFTSAGSSESLSKATAAGRRLARQNSQGDFRTKEVGYWTVEDVSAWLKDILVEQYAPNFAQNEISGTILLDITLEDLDYMNIKVLGHRKIILKAIEDLRNNRRYAGGLSGEAPTAPGLNMKTLSASNMDSTLQSSSAKEVKTERVSRLTADTDCIIAEARNSASVPKAKPVHWSHVEPLSSNPVTGGGVDVNGADETDVLEEAAEQLAFQDAVKQWRQGGSTQVAIEREYLGEGEGDSEQGFSLAGGGSVGTEWVNPFGPATQKLATDRKGSGEEGVKKGFLAVPEGETGVLDEEKEHAEFVKAVESWRRGQKPVSNQQSNHEPGAEVLVGTDDAVSSPRDGMQALAQKLAQQLDQEQLETVQALQRRKEVAEQKLREASLELERTRLSRKAQEDKSGGLRRTQTTDFDFEDSDVDSESPLTLTHSPPKSAQMPAAFQYSKTPQIISSPRINQFDTGTVECKSPSVTIALVESLPLQLDSPVLQEQEDCYEVEYDSD